MLSIILPSYNEEINIERTATSLKEILQKNNISYELIFINDGSTDNTWKKIDSCGQSDPNIKGISFSRNFGKEACITAGLRNCHGDCCVVMDCDLQHPPEVVVKMYRLWENGYEIVEGVKSTRGQESRIHKIFAKSFYNIISKLIGINMKDSSDFKLLDRKVINAICEFPEKNTFFRALSFWVGFKSVKISYDVLPREFGTTKWSFKKLFLYAINNLSSFTTVPLQFITIIGGFLSIISIIGFFKLFVDFICGYTVKSFFWISLLLIFLMSCIMVGLGILGYYVAKIYREVIGRPQYIISDICNFENEKREKLNN